MIERRGRLSALIVYEYKQFYRRKLPHIHSPGATLFITFRLADSIPKSVITRYKNEKLLLEKQFERAALVSDSKDRDEIESLLEFRRRWFKKFDSILDEASTGPVWLRQPEVAQIVADGLSHRDHKDFDLKAYCIMSNHVHALLKPLLNDRSLVEINEAGSTRFKSIHPTVGVIMKSLKGYTGRMANRLLDRTGPFWETESYDHEVRNGEELLRVVGYILNNPVKAGLVNNWRKWPWNWVSRDLEKYFP